MTQQEELKEVLDALRQVQSTLKELDERSKRTEGRLDVLEGKPAASEAAASLARNGTVGGGGALVDAGAPSPLQAPAAQAPASPVTISSQASPPDPGSPRTTLSPVPSTESGSPVEVAPLTTVSSQAPSTVPVRVGASGKAPKKPEGSLESRIGMYWLNRLGVVILVIGLGYLLSHAYEMIGPIGKLAVGFFASAALIAGGELLARRPKLAWYGQGLVGGGWALAYFAVYAMQNISTVKVIDDPLLASAGLLAVAVASMAHAVFRRSEAIGMLASILAFGTISLSAVTAFSVVATAIIVGGLAVTVVRMRWYAVQLASVAATYGTYVLFTNPQVAALDEYGGFWLSFAFLSVFWCVFSIVSLLLARAALQAVQEALKVEKPGQAVTTFSGLKRFATLDVLGLNAGAFVVLTVAAMDGALAEYRWAFCLVAAALHGAVALAAHRIKWSDGSTLASLIGLGLFTAFVPLKLDSHATMVVWLLQVPLMMFVGTRANARSFRWFGYVLAVLTAINVWQSDLPIKDAVSSGVLPVAYGLVIGAAAVAAYFASSLSLRYSRSSLSETEREFAKPLFGALATGFLLLTTCWHASEHVMPVCFVIECVAVIALAIRWSSPSVHGVAAIFFASAAISLVALYDQVGLPVAVAVTLLLYGLALAHRKGLAGVPKRLRIDAFHVCFLATTASVYLSTVFRADGVHTYLPLALEMALIGLAGFLLRDRVVRLAGLSALLPVAAFVLLQRDGWSWAVVPPVVACASALYAAYRLLPLRSEDGEKGALSSQLAFCDEQESGFASSVLGVGASLLLTCIFWQLLSWRTLAGAWALEGLVLVALGFVIRDKLLRLTGLGVFALMLAKLLFFDLSGAATVERIVSFIAAGVVLLVASFAYSRFEGLLEGDEQKSSRND